MTAFQRRVGAAADVSELLYIAALHQTSPILRENATVSSLDIVRFLKSEGGMDVSHDDGIRIVRGLGGGRGRDETMDTRNRPVSPCNETKMVPKSSRKANKLSIHLLETLLKSLWRRLFKRRVRNDGQGLTSDHNTRPMEHSEQVTHKDSTATTTKQSSPKAKVVNHFGGTLAGSSIQRLDSNGNLETVQEIQSTQTPKAGSPGGSPGANLCRLGSSEDSSTTNNMPGLQYSPDDSQAKVLMHLGGSLAHGPSIRKLDSCSNEEEQEALPTNRVLDYSVPQEEYLDLVQLLAILLMPTLEQMGNEYNEWKTVGHWTFDNPTNDNGQQCLHSTLLADVLSAMLSSLKSHDESFPTLNTKLVRDLLIAHGEFNRAEDAVLVERMVEAAHSSTFLLDEEALVNALTLDLNDIETGRLPNRTTGYRNSTKSRRYHRVTIEDESEDEREVANDLYPDALHLDLSYHSLTSEITMEHFDHYVPVERTGEKRVKVPLNEPVSAMDVTAPVRHASLALAVAVSSFLTCVALSFVPLFQQIQFQTNLPLLDETLQWLVFAVSPVLAGYAVVVPLGIANDPLTRIPLRILAAFSFVASLTEITILVTSGIEGNSYETWNYIVVVGSFTSALVLLLFSRLLGSDARGVARSNGAAANKINDVLENAHTLLSGSRLKEETLLNFERDGERYDECGGLCWTWRMLLSGELYGKDGISIAPRLYVIQFVQLVCILFMVYLGLCFINQTVDGSQEWHGAIASSGLEDWISEVVPNPTQLKMILYPAFFIALVDMVALFLVYVSSYVGTVLRYRCGLVPSLDSPRFAECRRSIPTIYRNIGNAAWGILGSGFLSFFLVAVILFLFVCPLTRGFMRMLVWWILSLSIATAAKQLVHGGDEPRLYNGFFPSNPQIANLVTLGLECCYIGLGGGFLVQRVSQLFFGLAFFTGRIDVPTGELFGCNDCCRSTSFVADLLQHEAHHHPYMERLLEVYKKKLMNDRFGSKAGACWRQLFVLALMPYLQKYRVGAGTKRMKRLESQTTQSLASLGVEKADFTSQATYSFADSNVRSSEEGNDS